MRTQNYKTGYIHDDSQEYKIIAKSFSVKVDKNPEIIERQLRLAIERYFSGWGGKFTIIRGYNSGDFINNRTTILLQIKFNK